MALIGTINSGNNLTFKNKLINGNFDFWQRATSGTPAAIWAYVSADRWAGHHNATAGTYSRSTNVPDSASTYSMRMTGVSGGTDAYLNQRVEAKEMREIIAKGAVTISGWIRRVGSPTASLSLGLICPTSADSYGAYTTHGAVFTVNNTITGNATASASAMSLTDNNTWYYFTMTDTSIASRTNIANGAQFYFAVGGLDANSKYFEFSRIQVEAGSVATPFEFRPLTVELTLCQRYYEKSYGLETVPGSTGRGGSIQQVNGADGNQVAGVKYTVPKRVGPAVTLWSDAGTAATLSGTGGSNAPNGGSWSAQGANELGFGCIVGSGGLSAATAYYFHYAASAEL